MAGSDELDPSVDTPVTGTQKPPESDTSSIEDVVKTEKETVLELVRRLEETQAVIDSEVDSLVLDTNPEGQKNKLEKAREKTRVFHKKQLTGVGDRNVIISNLPALSEGASYYSIIYYEKGENGQVQNISVGFLRTSSRNHYSNSGIKSDSNRTWRSNYGPNKDSILDFAAAVNRSHLDFFSEQKPDYERRQAVLVKADESDESKQTFVSAFKTSIARAKESLEKSKQEALKITEVPNRILQSAMQDIFGTEFAGKSSTSTPFPPPPAANRPAGPAGRQ